MGSEHLNQVLSRALRCLAHRGPDSNGRTVQSPWAMGHRRLSVIDPVGSAQPMADQAGRFWLSYNGELYNYRALREGLADHWRFGTQGDVEVVLAGLVVHGTSFLDRLEGQWALALWDRQAKQLLLVRDRMGKKPLYFQSDDQRFACASELGALAELSWFDWQEDPRSTADYLRYGYYLPGTTAYRQVQEVLPGHWLRWAPGCEMVQKSYWRLCIGGFDGPREQACNRLGQALVDAVQRRLVADVEVGALLSGGVDSSLVVSIVSQLLKQPIKTFTMGFSQASFDERPFARAMARRCQTRHYEACLALEPGMARIADQVLAQTGQPFADPSIVPTAGVCRLAAQHVKVAVSGDGGDELFSGYQRYLGRSLLRWYTRLPLGLRCSAERWMAAFPEPGLHHSASLMKKAHLFVEAARRLPSETPYVAPRYYSDEQLKELAPDIRHLGHRSPNIPDETSADDLQRMMAADALVYLPQDILTKVDRAGMAFSLEVRSPFLDRQVVELAFSLPRTWHRLGWKGKRMLADTFPEALPGWVWRRRKHGFGAPVHHWFRTGLQKRLDTLLHQVDHPLNHQTVDRMIAEHLSGRRDQGQRLWQIYIYLRWLETKPWRLC